MTSAELESYVRRVNRFDLISNAFISILAIAAGVFLIFVQDPKRIPAVLIWGAPVFLMGLGVVGLLTIRNMYRASTKDNTLSKQANIALLEQFASGFTGQNITASNSLVRFLYSPAWWGYSYVVFMTAEDNCIAVNVQTTGSAKGFIDFGAAKRMQRKIVSMIG